MVEIISVLLIAFVAIVLIGVIDGFRNPRRARQTQDCPYCLSPGHVNANYCQHCGKILN